MAVFNNSGSFLFNVGGKGRVEGKFESLEGIATDAMGNIYVADSDNHRIQTFDSAGIFQFAIGEHGSAVEQFREPEDIAISSDGSWLFIADTDNDRIQVFAIPEPSSIVVALLGLAGLIACRRRNRNRR